MGRVTAVARRAASSARFWQWFHAINVGKWIVLFPLGMSIFKASVPFLMYVSLDTALTGALTGYGTALAARKADPDDPT
jgi:hypothetical protein